MKKYILNALVVAFFLILSKVVGFELTVIFLLADFYYQWFEKSNNK